MHPVLRHLLDTDFADLAGSRIDGRIAITDELVNKGLHEAIATLTSPASAAKTTAPASPPPAATPTPYAEKATEMPDPKALLRKLDVEKLQYRTEAGRTVLEIACAVKK